MVGFVPNDHLSRQEKVLAGSISGVLTRFLTQPLEVIKLRIQLQKVKKKPKPIVGGKIVNTAAKIIRKEGVAAFWHGHKLGQLHSIVSVSCQFQSFEFATGFLSQHTNLYSKHQKTCNFMAGVFAGACSAAVTNPIEVIRVRQMVVGQQYSGLINGARQVYKHGGFFAFYRGVLASIIQVGPTVGITFGVFTTLQPLLLYYLSGCKTGLCEGVHSMEHAKSLLIASTIAGSAAGLVSKTLTYPIDLSKRRIQMKGDHSKSGRKLVKCSSLFKCMMFTFKKQGFGGLFVGLSITLLRAQITSIVAFTTYEGACFFMRNKHLFRSNSKEIPEEK